MVNHRSSKEGRREKNSALFLRWHARFAGLAIGRDEQDVRRPSTLESYSFVIIPYRTGKVFVIVITNISFC